MLEEYGLENCNPRSLEMMLGLKLILDMGAPKMDS
jgi:hypothetical protein